MSREYQQATDKQLDFLAKWKALTQEIGRPPQYREFQSRYGIKNVNNVTYNIKALARRGLMVKRGSSWHVNAIEYGLVAVRESSYLASGSGLTSDQSMAHRMPLTEATERAINANSGGRVTMAIVPIQMNLGV